MQFIVLTLLLATASSFAKVDWCKFDADFSQKYMEARSKYAQSIKKRKPGWKSTDDYSYGYDRRKYYGKNWESVSMREQIQRQFGTTDVEYVVKDNGKMLIYPRGMTEAKPAIIFDPSGDYFRVVKTKIKNGGIVDEDKYFNKFGQQVQRPKGMSDDDWKNKVMAETHFHANP